MPDAPTFEVVETGTARPGSQLLFGVSNLGMAGLSAVNYLVEQLDVDLVGHVEQTNFPAIAPVEAGEPREPMRLYTSEAEELTLFSSELIVPVSTAESFADGFLDWVTSADIEELVFLYGVPFPHGPEQHKVYTIATPDYRERALRETDFEPLGGGFLDGIVAEVVLRALEDEAPPTGVFVTPAHPPGPDLEAALRLLEAVQEVAGFAVDEHELRESLEQMQSFYRELGERLDRLQEGEQTLLSRDYPEDRMFM